MLFAKGVDMAADVLTVYSFIQPQPNRIHCSITLALPLSLEINGTSTYFVVVHIQIVWRRKYCNQRWKTCCLTLSVHSISVRRKKWGAGETKKTSENTIPLEIAFTLPYCAKIGRNMARTTHKRKIDKQMWMVQPQ